MDINKTESIKGIIDKVLKEANYSDFPYSPTYNKIEVIFRKYTYFYSNSEIKIDSNDYPKLIQDIVDYVDDQIEYIKATHERD